MGSAQSNDVTRPGPIVIGGVGDGIGLSIARRFARDGHPAILVARDQEKLEGYAEEIEAEGGSAFARSSDFRNEDAVAGLFDELNAQFGPPEVAVFNAGSQYKSPLLETPAKMFEKLWRLACFAGFVFGREAARHMLAEGRGTILFTGATASMRGNEGFAAFSAAKFGLRACAESMARELGPKGIHVASVIIDGGVDMPIIHQRFPDLRERVGEDGLLAPDEVAETYIQIHRQSRSAWSSQVDLRPWSEHF